MPTELRPPAGGTPPPQSGLIAGERVDLAPLARETATRFRAEFPDEADRYGDAGFEWCVHDTQWLLGWAAADDPEAEAFERNVRWLAGLLHARSYPLDRLGRDLELAADVVEETRPGADDVAARLRAGADVVRALPART